MHYVLMKPELLAYSEFALPRAACAALAAIGPWDPEAVKQGRPPY